MSWRFVIRIQCKKLSTCSGYCHGMCNTACGIKGLPGFLVASAGARSAAGMMKCFIG